jgi:hypothetical protein
MGDPEPVEPLDRSEDRRRAVIDVVGEPDRRDPALAQGSAGQFGIGEKALLLDRVAGRRVIETAFEVGEDEVGFAHLRPDAGERHSRIIDVHQIHVADEDQPGRHLEFLPCDTYICYYQSVEFEWDEAKRRANILKHGIDFVDAIEVFAGFFCRDRRLPA